jgi:hypothetical protein
VRQQSPVGSLPFAGWRWYDRATIRGEVFAQPN